MMIQDSFLLDEVRCGFLVPSAVKQAWAAELEVLMEIDRVCRKHNIQYFADWGTLLGAVRHGGFVPWDDDLDIVMKRADYEKFMSVARFDMEEGFDVQTYRNQKDFWFFMGKVVGKNRFCFEKEHLRRFHNFPYIACVDIFVLDYVHRDPKKEEQRKLLCKYMLGVADAIVEGKLSPAERSKSLEIIREMSGKTVKDIADPVEMGRYLYGEVEKLFAEVPEQEADNLTQIFPWGLKLDSYYIPKKYYETSLYLPFECTEIPVPMYYDKMLRRKYGDYMRLVKAGGGHNYPFFEGQRQNLQKVLDFELPEFRFRKEMLYRSQEELESKNYSYKVMAKECIRELWGILEKLEQSLSGEETVGQDVTELLQNSQQLAVDLGTLLEQMLGEGTKIVHLLEQYCEVLYLLYEQMTREGYHNCVVAETVAQESGIAELIKQLSFLQEQITVAVDEIIGRKTVLFLPVLAKDWDGLQILWETAVKDPFCDVYVVPLPYYYKDYDGSAKEILCDVAAFPEEVGALDYRLLTAEYMEMLHPETIIIQNPYDAWNSVVAVPELFYSQHLRQFTDELIYVPPFAEHANANEVYDENSREYSNMKYYVTMPGVVYADKVLVASERKKQGYIKKLVEFSGEETRGHWEQKIEILEERACDAGGNITMDVQMQEGMRNDYRKKKILYGISCGVYMENEAAAHRKMEKTLRILEQYKEQLEVIVLRFPEDNGCNAEEYDAYYGDPMPIVTAFMQAGKPVLLQNVDE